MPRPDTELMPEDEAITALADNSLRGRRARRVEARLAERPDLQASLAHQRRAVALLRELSPALPPTLRARIEVPVTRATTPAMRRMLYVAGAFVLIAGFQLFILGEWTEDFFAWTIDPPLTAAFLGAGYWSSAVLELGSAPRREWSRARLAMPVVLFFTTLTLALSLIHIDRFNLDSIFGVAWMAVYACFPVAMATILFLQLRAPGVDAPRQRPLAPWLRFALVTHAVVLFALGLALYIAPEDAASLWPWTLTPLTGRAVGAWLLGTAFIAGQMVIENARERVDLAMLSYAGFGALQLVALARYLDTPEWSALGAVAYVSFLVSMVAVGLYGWLSGRR